MKIANDINFDVIMSESKDIVLIYLWSTFCGPCKLFSPIVDIISNLYSEKLDVIKVNVEEGNNIINKYGVTSVPTIILTDKNTIIARKVGATNKNGLIEFINKFIQ